MGAVLDLFRVLFEPAAVFERVREKPRFLAPFAAIVVLQLVIALLQLPYTKAGMAAAFAQAARPGAPDPSRFAAIGLVFIPIGLAIAFVISGVLLWILVSLFAGEAKFATLLSVVTYAGVTAVLLSAAGLASLMLKGVANVTSPADLQPALGLDLLVPDTGRFLGAMLKAVNPFTIWGLILTPLGIQTTHKTSPGTAYRVAGVGFVIGTLIGASFSLLGPATR